LNTTCEEKSDKTVMLERKAAFKQVFKAGEKPERVWNWSGDLVVVQITAIVLQDERGEESMKLSS